MFIDGAWTDALSGETFDADSPATGETIGSVPRGDRADAQLAIGAANRLDGVVVLRSDARQYRDDGGRRQDAAL